MVYFWGQLCGVWDQQKETPKLSRIVTRRSRKNLCEAIYDLHSLRVAGVSALLDAGLPLGIVASITGHRSLAMVLHYYRAERAEIRLRMKDAYARLGGDKILQQIERKLTECEDYETWLRSTPEGFENLRIAKQTKVWTISISGICPGTSCEDGLPREYKNPHGTFVPGSLCPLCRFHVYGAPFVPGLVHDLNSLLFTLEEKANRQDELIKKAEEAEDLKHFSEMEIFRGEAERLELECALQMKVLGRLNVMINECLDTLNAPQKNSGNSTGLALISPQPNELRASVQLTGSFDRLSAIYPISSSVP